MKIKVVCAFCGEYYMKNINELSDEDIPFLEIDKNGEVIIVHACENCYFKPCNTFKMSPELIESTNKQLVKFFNADSYIYKKTEDGRHLVTILTNKK